MIIDGVPGLTIHEHEGRLAGTFELPPADLAAISFNGRVMLVIVADVGAPFRVTTDVKEDLNRAHWTFKALDAAIVRDVGMRDHLAQSLYLDGAESVDVHPLDEPTTGLGCENCDYTGRNPSNEAPCGYCIEEAKAEIEEEKAVKAEVEEEKAVERELLFAKRPAPVASTGEEVERIGGPIRTKDKRLDAYLYDDEDR